MLTHILPRLRVALELLFKNSPPCEGHHKTDIIYVCKKNNDSVGFAKVKLPLWNSTILQQNKYPLPNVSLGIFVKQCALCRVFLQKKNNFYFFVSVVFFQRWKLRFCSVFATVKVKFPRRISAAAGGCFCNSAGAPASILNVFASILAR